MKKTWTMILALVMILSAIACGALADGEGSTKEGAFNIGVYMWMSGRRGGLPQFR